MPQENNMAEVIRLLHTVIGKVDGLASGLERVETKVQVLETKMESLEGKVDILSGQFQDVARVVIENTQRIEGLEGRVDILESKAN